MKKLLLASLLLLASCSSSVLVRMDSCAKIKGDIYECEEVK